MTHWQGPCRARRTRDESLESALLVSLRGDAWGAFDAERSLWLRSTGESGPLSEDWEASLPSGGWAAFTDPERSKVLAFWREGDAEGCRDSYYPMPPMTVFGFGHPLRSVRSEMERAPRLFGMAFVSSVEPSAIESAVARCRAAQI